MYERYDSMHDIDITRVWEGGDGGGGGGHKLMCNDIILARAENLAEI